MDDCIIAHNSDELKSWFLREFEKEFNQSADSGEDTYIGITYEVFDAGRHVTLNTPRLWQKLHDRVAHLNLPRVRTPLPRNAMDLLYAPSDDTLNPMITDADINIRELLGLAGWAVCAVRPGEVFSASLIARRAHEPTRNVGVVLLHFISYLLDHRDDKMHVVADNKPVFTGVSDASFANCPVTKRSWFGFCLVWCGIAFAFVARLQPYVAPSTRDAEIGAMVYCVKSMIGTLLLLHELGFYTSDMTPLVVETDSTSALAGMNTDWIHKESRWNSIRLLFVRDFVRALLIKGAHVSTKLMRANPLTKVPSSGAEHARERAALMGQPPAGHQA